MHELRPGSETVTAAYSFTREAKRDDMMFESHLAMFQNILDEPSILGLVVSEQLSFSSDF